MSALDPDEREFRRLLGRRIRIRRTWLELSQENLATAAGLTRNFVSALERAEHGVDVYRLLRLARALDLPLAALIADDEDGSHPRPAPRRR